MGRLVDFVNSLAEDPELEELFDREPIAIMSRAGLEPHEQEVLLNGTTQEIRNAIAGDLGDGEMEAFVEGGPVVYVIKMLHVIKMSPA
jgi:hypothetical protein